MSSQYSACSRSDQTVPSPSSAPAFQMQRGVSSARGTGRDEVAAFRLVSFYLLAADASADDPCWKDGKKASIDAWLAMSASPASPCPAARRTPPRSPPSALASS